MSGKDLYFIKALLQHMDPISRSLSITALGFKNKYEEELKLNNAIQDDIHDDLTY
jgi:hypothetical protein